jgi:ligand-binding sensor domain-containing protein
MVDCASSMANAGSRCPLHGVPEHRVQWVLHDSRGTFWVLADLKIWMRAAGQAAFEDTGIAVSQMATLAESPQGEVWLADRVRGTSPLANAQGLLPDSEREARRLPELVAARLQFTADGALWATMSPHGGVARVTFDGTAPCAWSASIRRTG